MRLPYKARFKYSINKTINFITSSLHGKAVENAENKIGEYFKKYTSELKNYDSVSGEKLKKKMKEFLEKERENFNGEK